MTGWQPTASRALLQARAHLMAGVRDFFDRRQVMEVETPLLNLSAVTDPHIDPILARPFVSGPPAYLQTSPEYAMKRLLAAGSGPIYQICKAFRGGEAGRRHSPEFTLLEWYRPGFSLQQLQGEVLALLDCLVGPRPAQVLSYREALLRATGLDPVCDGGADFRRAAAQLIGSEFSSDVDEEWWQLLMDQCVEPAFDPAMWTVVTEWPLQQAALAKSGVDADGFAIGRRFEIYSGGLELANAYDELLDPKELKARWQADNAALQAAGREPRPLDEQLLAAQMNGLPDCSGVAMGLDRVLMLSAGKNDIAEVLAFSPFRS